MGEEKKDIVQRYMTPTGQIAIANVLVEVEERLLGLEEAMTFFSNWYNKTHASNIILPSNLDESGSSKIILPNG